MSPHARKLLLVGIPLLATVLLLFFWKLSERTVSTENAYVKSSQIIVSPQVSGVINSVSVAENQTVHQGDLLVTIDSTPFKAAVAEIEAELDSIRIDVESDRAAYRQKKQELILAQENLQFMQREFKRQSNLSKKGMNSETQLDTAEHNQSRAKQEIAIIGEDIDRLLTALNGNPDLLVDDHPRYRAALARLDNAKLDERNCQITAPIDGIATRLPNTGEFATIGRPLMSIVSNRHFWVEANFMETDLTRVQPGMTAEVDVDAYPDKTWLGVVDSISPATGAEFSILPPQNASGNWVKITQRIPLRVSIDWRDGDPALRKGMTAEVVIHLEKPIDAK